MPSLLAWLALLQTNAHMGRLSALQFARRLPHVGATLMLIGVGILLMPSHLIGALAGDVIYIVPSGDERLRNQDPASVLAEAGLVVEEGAAVLSTLREALESAPGGSTIQLLDGVYLDTEWDADIALLSNGSPNSPLTIRGLGSKTVIQGTRKSTFSKENLIEGNGEPPFNVYFLPDVETGANCKRFIGQSWIVLENMRFSGCNDSAVAIQNSRYITIRNIEFVGGQNAVLARGTGTRNIILENSTWVQDPSEAMWRRNHWCEYKHPKGLLKHLNGALFQSYDIAGSVVIRRNSVRHAFNGVRMNVGETRDLGKHNANVHIYDNDFLFVRDNAIEPEHDATNWWMHDNRIFNVHAWFSFDGRYGRNWHLFQNVGWFDERPTSECDTRCQQWARIDTKYCGDLHNGGQVFKFRNLKSNGSIYPVGPLYVFNNSWHLRSSIAKKGKFGRFHHWNNAIEYCRADDHPNGSCDERRAFFQEGFKWNAYDWHHDMSNHEAFPEDLRRRGYLVKGISIASSEDVFEGGATGDFRLTAEAARLGIGCRLEQHPIGKLTCATAKQKESAPAIGAEMQSTSRLNVHFRHQNTGTHRERPRVVHVELPVSARSTGDEQLARVVFSHPVRANQPPRLSVQFEEGGPEVISLACAIDFATIVCPFPSGTRLPGVEPHAVYIPSVLRSLDGQAVTDWAAEPSYVKSR